MSQQDEDKGIAVLAPEVTDANQVVSQNYEEKVGLKAYSRTVQALIDLHSSVLVQGKSFSRCAHD